MAELENSSVSVDASVCSDNQITPAKKRRSLPGMPDPEAEVIALSPKSLMATNRFGCEICGKGFQRDQNLQLHRRGHNLPWKLRQRAVDEPIRKRVYVCPEPSCVHHDPARALGDLTGIKKHFCRKHGDKKWTCDRCSKRYAVQSDLKAHLKICGSREYKCDCGTLFSRRDSFIKHRAFCDALAEETSRALPVVSATDNQVPSPAHPPPPSLTPSATVVSPALSVQSSEMAENNKNDLVLSSGCSNNNGGSGTRSVFASRFASTAAAATTQPPLSNFSPSAASEPTSLSLYMSNGGGGSSLFRSPADHYPPPPHPAISATALLQKAAQMGPATSNGSLFRGLGLEMSPSPAGWSVPVKQERDYSDGLGLTFPPNDLMMGPFGSRPTTVDFLGLGMGGGGGGSAGGLSALLTSLGAASGCFNSSPPGGQYGDGGGGCSPERNPNGHALH